MPGISVGAALGAGFGLIRRKPLAVLAWGAVLVSFQVAIIALLAPFYVHLVGDVMQQARTNPSAPPDVQREMPQMMAMQGVVQLLNIAQLVALSVVNCAVFRAVLHPEKSAYGYLRLGAPELMLTALIFAAMLLLGVLLVVVMLPVVLVFAAIAVTAAGGGHAAGAGVGMMTFLLVLIPVILIAALVIGVRFAFVGPMMVDDGRFHLFESWTLSKGRVGSLCLVALGLVAIAIAFEVALMAFIVSLGATALFATIGPQNILPFLQRPPAEILARLAPYLRVYIVALVPIGGGLTAVFAAPWAKAYRDLKPNAAEAFA